LKAFLGGLMAREGFFLKMKKRKEKKWQAKSDAHTHSLQRKHFCSQFSVSISF